jgi:hypothetical protein
MFRHVLRNWIGCVALLVAVSLPGAASAITSFGLQHTISLEWEETGTNGLILPPGTQGGPHVLNVVLQVGDYRVFGVDLSFVFDGAGANDLDYYPLAGGELGSLSSNHGLSLVQESDGSQQGILTDFDVVFNAGIRRQTITLGSIVFNVNDQALANGIDISPVVLSELSDGVWNNAHQDVSTLYPGKVAFIGAFAELPEPTTGFLLLSGVATLLWADRSRRSSNA